MSHLSFSQIDRYRKCGRQYAFIYLEGLRMPPGISMIKGSSVHKGIEFNSLYKAQTRKEMPRSDIVDFAVTDFEKRVESEEVVLRDGESIGAAKDQTVDLLGLYCDEISPAIQPVHVEVEYDMSLEGLPPIKAVIDCIDENNLIRDYKTTGKSKSQSDLDGSLQAEIYTMAYTQKFGAPPAGVNLDIMVETKTPKYQRLETIVDSGRTERAKNIIRAVHGGIQAGVFGPAPEGAWWCNPKFCGFWSRCEYGGRCHGNR